MLKISSDLLNRSLPAIVRFQQLTTNVKIDEKVTSFRTREASPKNHKVTNIGQFYTISPSIKKQLFSHGGLPKTFKEHVKTFTETCLMIREPALDVINCLEALDYTKPAVRFVLYGEKGNGKTLSLAHIIHYGLESGFLIVHVPWVGNWMRRCKESSNSETREDFIDINLDAQAWLVHFKNQNADLLSNPELKIYHEYMWSKREITPKGASLLDLIEHGINRVKFASDTIVAAATEIKCLSNLGKVKTLVAIDGFNAFFYPNTRIFSEKKEVVPPSKITVTEAFLNLTKFDWKNAAVVVTADELAIAEEDQISHLPK